MTRLNSKIYVVSAPSGTGKTSLNRELVKNYPQFSIAVSLTTRLPRGSEQSGIDYNFVSKEHFVKCLQAGRLLETAEVHGQMYGTSLDEIEMITSRKQTPILVIDVQGWKSVHKLIPTATSVFIMPPTVSELWKRLESRGTDKLQSRWRRLCDARKELTSAETYDYFIINDRFDSAYKQLENILVHDKPASLTKQEGVLHAQKLLKEFDEAEWVKDLKKQSEQQ